MTTDLKRFIRELNETWTHQRYDDLYEYFHENVVMLRPGTDKPVAGIEPMVQSYRDFGSMGTIHGFNIRNLEMFHFASHAMCHMKFYVDYEIESGRFQEEGLEIYAIDISGPKPKIVWRTQIALNPENNE